MADDLIGKAWYELGARNEQLDRDIRAAEADITASGKRSADAFARPMEEASGRIRERLRGVAAELNSLSGRAPEELAADLNRAAEAASEAQAAIRALSSADNLDPADARRYADALDEIGIEADQTVAELRELAAADPRFNTPEFQRTAQELDRIGREAKEGAAGLNEMKGVRADTHLEAVSNEAREAAEHMDRAGQKAGGLREQFSRMRGAIAALGIAVGVSTLTAFFGGAISAASDLNEEVSKTQVVFGDSADEVIAFADKADRALGQSKQQALGAAGAFGNMFRTIGFADDAAADMSTTMVRLASDMASFNNQDPSEMLDRLRSGLAGEAEPLRQYGVLISEARVKTKAYELGLAEAGAELTEQQKVVARYNLILEDTTLQQGDFARTSEGLANRQRAQAAVWENSLAQMGQALLPFATALTEFATDVMPGVADSFTAVATVAAPLLSLMLELAKLWLEHINIILPGLAAVLGVKLVASLASAERGFRLTGLAAKAAWSAALLGLPILLEAIDHLTGALGRIFIELEHGEEGVDQIERLTELVGDGKFARELYRWGVSAEDFQRVMDRTGFTAEEAFRAIADASGDTTKAIVENMETAGDDAFAATDRLMARITQRVRDETPAISDAARTAFNGLEGVVIDSIRDVPGGVAATLSDGSTIVAGSAEELLEAIPRATQRAKDRAVGIAAQFPGDIADAIIGNIGELEAVEERIEQILAGAVADATVLAKNYALLMGPNLAEAIGARSSEATDAMLSDVVDPLLTSLEALPAVSLATGEGIPLQMRDGLEAKGQEVVEALRLLTGDADATLAQLLAYARERGLGGIAALIEGMISKTADVRTAAARVAKAARDELRFDASAGGASSAQTFINGLVGTLSSWSAATRVQNAAQLLKTRSLGGSLPTAGPFSAGPLREAAHSVSDYWVDRLGARLREGVQRLGLDGLQLPSPQLSPAAALGALGGPQLVAETVAGGPAATARAVAEAFPAAGLASARNGGGERVLVAEAHLHLEGRQDVVESQADLARLFGRVVGVTVVEEGAANG